MKVFKFVSIAFAMLMTLLFSGCLFVGASPVKVVEFDLPPSYPEKSAARIGIGSVRNISGAERPLLFRKDDNRMVADNGRSWLVSPEMMVERMIRNRFCASSGEGKVDVVIKRFEFSGDKAFFEADFKLSDGPKYVTVAAAENQMLSEENFAEAMANAIDAALDKVEKAVEKTAGERGNGK